MDDIVERVGRAHAEFAGYPYEPDKSFWDGTARAAIEAMREPTTAMLHASTMQVPTWDNDASRRKWQAMIDAALKQKEPVGE